MKKYLFSTLLVFLSTIAFSQFISEIHYDNTGGDVGEFVEVTIPATCDCSVGSVIFYNGNGGSSYGTIDVSTPVDPVNDQVISVAFAGIQNGSPDGMALVCMGEVVEFISYEGSLEAINGPAAGMTSTDIGVFEPNSTPVGESLQLTDASWTGPLANTSGVVNAGLTPVPCIVTPVMLASFTAELEQNNAVLKWTTLSEEDNDVIEIQRSFNGLEWNKIGEVDGQGTTDERTDYQFEDKNLVNGTTFYQLNQIDFDGTSTLSDIVSITTDALSDLEIGAVNKQSINVTSSLEGEASFRLFNSMGELVANGEFEANKGNQSIYYRTGELASGFYIVQLELDGQVVTKKFVIQ